MHVVARVEGVDCSAADPATGLLVCGAEARLHYTDTLGTSGALGDRLACSGERVTALSLRHDTLCLGTEDGRAALLASTTTTRLGTAALQATETANLPLSTTPLLQTLVFKTPLGAVRALAADTRGVLSCVEPWGTAPLWKRSIPAMAAQANARPPLHLHSDAAPPDALPAAPGGGLGVHLAQLGPFVAAVSTSAEEGGHLCLLRASGAVHSAHRLGLGNARVTSVAAVAAGGGGGGGGGGDGPSSDLLLLALDTGAVMSLGLGGVAQGGSCMPAAEGSPNFHVGTPLQVGKAGQPVVLSAAWGAAGAGGPPGPHPARCLATVGGVSQVMLSVSREGVLEEASVLQTARPNPRYSFLSGEALVEVSADGEIVRRTLPSGAAEDP